MSHDIWYMASIIMTVWCDFFKWSTFILQNAFYFLVSGLDLAIVNSMITLLYLRGRGECKYYVSSFSFLFTYVTNLSVLRMLKTYLFWFQKVISHSLTSLGSDCIGNWRSLLKLKEIKMQSFDQRFLKNYSSTFWQISMKICMKVLLTQIKEMVGVDFWYFHFIANYVLFYIRQIENILILSVF